ncbi:hypothetical protein A2U01_0104720, partial [Trifolium medium]|nr:hypothetical protein [Trifolium medium]
MEKSLSLRSSAGFVSQSYIGVRFCSRFNFGFCSGSGFSRFPLSSQLSEGGRVTPCLA